MFQQAAPAETMRAILRGVASPSRCAFLPIGPAHCRLQMGAVKCGLAGPTNATGLTAATTRRPAETVRTTSTETVLWAPDEVQ